MNPFSREAMEDFADRDPAKLRALIARLDASMPADNKRWKRDRAVWLRALATSPCSGAEDNGCDA